MVFAVLSQITVGSVGYGTIRLGYRQHARGYAIRGVELGGESGGNVFHLRLKWGKAPGAPNVSD